MTTKKKVLKEKCNATIARKKIANYAFSLGDYLSAKNKAWDKKERQLAELRKKHKEATK